jgi:hypothetical protein
VWVVPPAAFSFVGQLALVAAFITAVVVLTSRLRSGAAEGEDDQRDWSVGRSCMGCLTVVMIFVGVFSLLIIFLYVIFSGSE